MNIKQLMLDYLQEEGFKAEEQPFGLAFRYQGCTFVFMDNEDDDTFFQIAMFGIYNAENDRDRALEACNAVSMGRKVVKCGIDSSNSVNLCFEILIDSSPEVSDIVPRALSMLVQAREAFYYEMEKSEQ